MSRRQDLYLEPRFVENGSSFEKIVLNDSDFRTSAGSWDTSDYINVGFIVFDGASDADSSLGALMNGITPIYIHDFSCNMKVNQNSGRWGIQLNKLTITARNSPYFSYTGVSTLFDYTDFSTASTSFTQKGQTYNLSNVVLNRGQALAIWCQCRKDSGYNFKTVQIHMGSPRLHISYMIYTVTLYDGSILLGSFDVLDKKSCPLGSMSKTGYTLTGWSNGSSTYSDRVPSVTSDMTLYAQWSINRYTISTAVQGSGTVTGAGTYDYQSTVTLVATPSEGYKFIGWTDGTTTATRTVTVGASNATYTAVFELYEYAVTYELNGGAWANGFTPSTKYTTNIGLALPTTDKVVRDGYSFMGWVETDKPCFVCDDEPNVLRKKIIANGLTVSDIQAGYTFYVLFTKGNTYVYDSLNYFLLYLYDENNNEIYYQYTRFSGTDGTFGENTLVKFVVVNNGPLQFSGSFSEVATTIPSGSTGNRTYTALLKYNLINKVLVNNSKIKGAYVNGAKVKSIFINNTKVYW